MLAWTLTQTNGINRKDLPKSLLNVISTFCEGYGTGFYAIVLKSPHKHLIGQQVKVDLRNKDFNQYFVKLK